MVFEGWLGLLPSSRDLFHPQLRLLGLVHQHKHGIGGRGAHLSRTAKGGAAAVMYATKPTAKMGSPDSQKVTAITASSGLSTENLCSGLYEDLAMVVAGNRRGHAGILYLGILLLDRRSE